jgi:dimethylamine/trimethylamine dehydrogenase
MLAEASRHLGGRVSAESTLPGLQEWARVRDYRVQQLQQMNNVEVFLESDMSAQDILELSPHHVAIATGSRWRTDTSGRHNGRGIEGLADSPGVYSVEQAIVEALPEGNYLVYDDDHYHMASSIAEKLALAGNQVCYVTPADRVAVWSIRTVEQYRVHGRLHELGVRMITAHLLTAFDGTRATLGCVFTDVQQAVDAQFLVPVTARLPMDNLYYDLAELVGNSSKSEPFSFEKIGDCDTPGLIADAVFFGHRWARELDCEVDTSNPMKYDRVFYADS